MSNEKSDGDAPVTEVAGWRFNHADEQNTIQGSIDGARDLIRGAGNRLSSRRQFMGQTAKVGGGALALSAIGTGSVAAAEDGSEMEEGSVSDLNLLNFALTLERLEATFYAEALASSGGMFDEHDIERSDAAKVFAPPGARFSTYQKFEAIRDHERAHVEALTQAIEQGGGDPVSGLEFDFPYTTVAEFIDIARTLEDIGVAAYARAAPLISNEEYLKAALSIHSVEARHASYLRVLNTQSPFPDAFDPALSLDQVLQAAESFIVSE